MSKLIVKDKRWQVVKKQALYGKDAVKVGVIDGGKQEEDSGLTVAQVASFHEFGGPANNPPQRSFIRSTISINKELYSKRAAGLTKRILEGKLDKATALDLFGTKIASDIKRRIQTKQIKPELAESTIKRKTVRGKRGDTPLVNTGQLLGSITHEVVSKGGS